MAEYRLKLGDRSIVIGDKITFSDPIKDLTEGSLRQNNDDRWEWGLQAGIYRAADIVRELGVLLAATVIQLGAAADAKVLLDNIRASLAITGREAVLPLGDLALGDKARTEVAAQARRIGEALTRWAREFEERNEALERYGGKALAALQFRSRCDQHLWTPQAAAALTGPAGSPAVMQLFNEYLHQIVLLRDALLPFDNWEEVPIELSGGGLRFLEQARTEFLAELMVKKLSHKALVRFAQRLLVPRLPDVGYGFQYRQGVILPASLGAESPATAPRYLLSWHPARIVTEDRAGDALDAVSFSYEYEDYYAAPRSLAGEGDLIPQAKANEGDENIREAHIATSAVQSKSAVLSFRIKILAEAYSVDLGQSFRGHRFMYRSWPIAKAVAGNNDGEQSAVIQDHSARRILDLPGLVTNDDGVHLISAGANPLVQWALLGKLYPENVILLELGGDEELKAAQAAGKGFGAKFLVH